MSKPLVKNPENRRPEVSGRIDGNGDRAMRYQFISVVADLVVIVDLFYHF